MRATRYAFLLLLTVCLCMGTVLASDHAAPAKVDAAKEDPFVNNACVLCHRDLAGRSGEITNLEWNQSVHHNAKVGCDGCHGGDASVRRDQFSSDEAYKRAAHMQRNPEFTVLRKSEQEFVGTARGRSISYFCGRCHAQIKEKHLGSPHGDFGDPTCLYCHGQGSHKIVHPTPQIIDTRPRTDNGRCSPCHTANTMKALANIKTLLLDTEKSIDDSGKQYKELESWGYRNLELEKLHHHVAETHSELRRIFHSFNMRDISNFAGEIKDTAERTDATYQLVAKLRHTQRQQAMIGLGAVVLLLSLSSLLLYYKHTFLEPHDH